MTSRLRQERTRNLVDAAKSAGAQRITAQSISRAESTFDAPRAQHCRADLRAGAGTFRTQPTPATTHVPAPARRRRCRPDQPASPGPRRQPARHRQRGRRGGWAPMSSRTASSAGSSRGTFRQGRTVQGIQAPQATAAEMETAVAPRYGILYGPGTWCEPGDAVAAALAGDPAARLLAYLKADRSVTSSQPLTRVAPAVRLVTYRSHGTKHHPSTNRTTGRWRRSPHIEQTDNTIASSTLDHITLHVGAATENCHSTTPRPTVSRVRGRERSLRAGWGPTGDRDKSQNLVARRAVGGGDELAGQPTPAARRRGMC